MIRDGRRLAGYRILAIEAVFRDFNSLRSLLEETFGKDYELARAESLTEGIRIIEDGNWDVVFLDMGLPDSVSGSESIRSILAKVPFITIIVMTGLDSEEASLEALKAGAQDYLVKGIFDSSQLKRSVSYSLERSQLKQDLVTRNQELQDFAYACSHDLKEPSRTIGLIAERTLSKVDNMDVRAVEALRRISDYAKWMAAMTDQIMAICSVEDISEELVPFEPRDVFNEVFSRFSVRLAEGDSLICDGPWAPVVSSVEVLKKVAFQLVDNAIKYRASGRNLKFSVTFLEGGSEWEFLFQDNGIGISEKDRDRIFHVFERLNERDKTLGSGLGLSTCRKLLEKIGGSIDVKSSHSNMTIFSVKIPKNSGSTEGSNGLGRAS